MYMYRNRCILYCCASVVSISQTVHLDTGWRRADIVSSSLAHRDTRSDRQMRGDECTAASTATSTAGGWGCSVRNRDTSWAQVTIPSHCSMHQIWWRLNIYRLAKGHNKLFRNEIIEHDVCCSALLLKMIAIPADCCVHVFLCSSSNWCFSVKQLTKYSEQVPHSLVVVVEVVT